MNMLENINQTMTKQYCKIKSNILKLKDNTLTVLGNNRGASHFVEIIIAIIVILVIAFVFKDELISMFESFFGQANEKIGELFDGATGSNP